MGNGVPIPMPEPGESVRRRYPRYQLSVPFDITVFRPGAVVRLNGRTQELGEGGLRGVVSGSTLPGERVELSVSLPSCAEPLNLRAVIRYECELQCGFEFLSLGQVQREQLQQLAASGLRGKMINSAEWEAGLAPPPRGATAVCSTCGFEFLEELGACSACGAAQESEAEELEPAQQPLQSLLKTPPKPQAEPEKVKPKRDAVLDSVVAIVFLITLSIGLWQWLYSPADVSAQPSPVTVELENVFLRPKPSVTEEGKRESQPTPAFKAARSLVSAVIGKASPEETPEPIGVPGSAARESTSRRARAAVTRTPEYRRFATSPATPSPAPAATAPASAANRLAAAVSSAASAPASSAASAMPSERPSASDLEGMLLQKVLPMYPARARRDGVQGQVVLKAVIGKDGTIAALRPLEGPQELSAAAMDAVQHWRFRPYQMNGKPVEVETDIRLNFQLPK